MSRALQSGTVKALKFACSVLGLLVVGVAGNVLYYMKIVADKSLSDMNISGELWPAIRGGLYFGGIIVLVVVCMWSWSEWRMRGSILEKMGRKDPKRNMLRSLVKAYQPLVGRREEYSVYRALRDVGKDADWYDEQEARRAKAESDFRSLQKRLRWDDVSLMAGELLDIGTELGAVCGNGGQREKAVLPSPYSPSRFRTTGQRLRTLYDRTQNFRKEDDYGRSLPS
jgi:hypothetical protein